MGGSEGEFIGWKLTQSIHLLPAAEQDLLDARFWLESQKSGLGLEFAQSVIAAVEALVSFPELHGIVYADIRGAPIRKHPYVIYYRVSINSIEILAVLHGSRDPAILKSRATFPPA